MDRDEEMGHGDRSLLFIGDEDDDLGADRDGGSPPTSSSDEGSSFSDRSDDEARGGGGDDAPDDGQKGAWPQSYRFVNQPPRPPAIRS
jgi:vesicular inhibitory amino acid transporter